MKRTRVFLSHARPDDDVFTQWLALQLAKSGYEVWCDLTKLLGGEKFYPNIESIIRGGTAKFLFILSRASNQKDGPLEELQVAKNTARSNGIEDFIVPLHLDDLPRDEMSMGLNRFNSIPFDKGWASGLTKLLEKLEQDEVPKSPQFNPDAVTNWWREQYKADAGVVRQPSECLSNLFRLKDIPPKIYFHALSQKPPSARGDALEMPYPAAYFNSHLVTFAPRADFASLGPVPLIDNSHEFDTLDFLEGVGGRNFVEDKQRYDVIYQLLRLIWLQMIKSRSLSTYTISNRDECFYFLKDQTLRDEISFIGVKGKKTYRGVVGYKTLRDRLGNEVRRYWHFGLTARPHISSVDRLFSFCIKPHVLFSDDGQHLWDNKSKMHSARRNQCAMWWNAEWRDRILASMTWLAQGAPYIQVPVGDHLSVEIEPYPIPLVSPVTHLEVEQEPEPEFEIEPEELVEDEGDV